MGTPPRPNVTACVRGRGRLCLSQDRCAQGARVQLTDIKRASLSRRLSFSLSQNTPCESACTALPDSDNTEYQKELRNAYDRHREVVQRREGLRLHHA